MDVNEWYNTTIKGIPKSEQICIRYCSEDGMLKYIVTKDRYGNYKLYRYKDGQAVYSKHKADNPIDLNEYINT